METDSDDGDKMITVCDCCKQPAMFLAFHWEQRFAALCGLHHQGLLDALAWEPSVVTVQCLQ